MRNTLTNLCRSRVVTGLYFQCGAAILPRTAAGKKEAVTFLKKSNQKTFESRGV
jgi:hypothetical protein